MCGIAGIAGDWDKLEQVIVRMRDIFPYRGPDDSGHWIHPEYNVAFGHRRLSILDPTLRGHQPMQDERGQIVITYNGEVYNYLEIREELAKRGHRFRTGTDTEIILKAYLEWGTGCVQYFNGMFAFAIWDEKYRSIFLARDRLGIKPLYFFSNGVRFCFASEVKAILAILTEKPSLNYQLIDLYMSFGYVPGEVTLFNGIKRLLPGHYALFRLNKSLEIKKYWDLQFENNVDRGERYYLEQAQHLLNSSIDLRLRSDVPLGIFLSGGLDSSAVVGMLAPRVNEPLKTFSVAYDFGPEFDETPYSRLVSEKFNTDHYEIFITTSQFKDFIPDFVWLMDEPVTESAAISLYFVSKLAKDHVTVVLSGEGSDEVFAGYDLYRYMILLERYYSLFGKNFGKIFADFGNKFLPSYRKLSKYLRLGALPLPERYKGISTYEEKYKDILYRSDFAEYCRQSSKRSSSFAFLQSLFETTKGKDVLSRMLYFDTKTWLVDDLLIKADRMSMAASLELRVPFLDYRLVEFAASMPSKYKIRNNVGKYLLKKMMEGVLPKKIISRQKMGFPTPLKIMFAKDLFDYANDVLLAFGARISEFFKPDAVAMLLEEHRSQKADHHRVLWQLIVLEEWLRVRTYREDPRS